MSDGRIDKQTVENPNLMDDEHVHEQIVETQVSWTMSVSTSKLSKHAFWTGCRSVNLAGHGNLDKHIVKDHIFIDNRFIDKQTVENPNLIDNERIHEQTVETQVS